MKVNYSDQSLIFSIFLPIFALFICKLCSIVELKVMYMYTYSHLS